MRPRQTESNEQILVRLRQELVAKQKLDAGGQLTMTDVDHLDPAGVRQAVTRGQLLVNEGIPQSRRPR